jgi:hypothetical protein
MSEMLIDFRKLSAPSKDAIAKRNEKIEELKKQLGTKYLLARLMPRITL